MINNHKIIISIFAGRQDRMSITLEYLKYLIESKTIDEIHIFDFTKNENDKLWLKFICANNNVYKYIDIYKNYAEAFNHYINYPKNTVLIKIDDDIVYIDKYKFDKFIKFRIENPEYFIVFGNVVNNIGCSFLHKEANIINYDFKPENLYHNGLEAEKLHLYFIDNIKNFTNYFNDEINIIKLGERFGIGFMSMLGKDFCHFADINDGELGGDEHILTVIKPQQLNRNSCIYLPLLASHLSYHTQDSKMDTKMIIEKYNNLFQN